MVETIRLIKFTTSLFRVLDRSIGVKNIYCHNRSFAARIEMAPKPCVFCGIIEKNDDKIIFKDDKVVVFPDIRPASQNHFLIVPKEHIADATALVPDQKYLVEHMVEVATNLLSDKNCSQTDSRLGFHWPPFHSISHLHLHAIAPSKGMSLLSRIIFKENSWWFVTPDYVISRL